METRNEIQRWYVYILLCSDGTHYVGRTNDLDDRLERHNAGKIRYTSRRRPLQLDVALIFTNEWKAVQFEKYLKSGSGRAFAKRHLY